MREADFAAIAGTDAAVFLRFVRMLRNIITAMAAVCAVTLIPTDIAYNIMHPAASASASASSTTPTSTGATRRAAASSAATGTDATDSGISVDQDRFMFVTMALVQGASLWAHVVMTYLVTLIALAFIFVNYRQVIRLRHRYFTSYEYQSSYFSRTLMVTGIDGAHRSSDGLRELLGRTKIPYPLTDAQIGRATGKLPDLLQEQKRLVRKLERVLNLYLAYDDPTRPRPTVRVHGHFGGVTGGAKVDAIDHYSHLLSEVETQIASEREHIDENRPQAFGFASLAAIPYAHAAAKMVAGKHPQGLTIRLASSPRDILWQNLALMPGERKRSKVIGFFYLCGLVLLNSFPLFFVALISNMSVFRQYLGFLQSWSEKSSFSFSAVSGLFPPLVSMTFALLLPKLLCKIATYRGVCTREARDRTLLAEYFAILALTQFFAFMLIGVLLLAGLLVYENVRHHQSAGNILSTVGILLLQKMSYQLPFQSVYWMSWIAIRGYMLIFELAQVYRLVFVWLHKHVSKRTPRELHDFVRPPSFDYWICYPELLFLAGIAIVYVPLAPLVGIFAAAVLWMASFVYQHQLMYVYTTKSETGGRLWLLAVNRLLVILVFMQLVIAVAIGLRQQNWVKAISCLPPICFVIAFKIYSHIKLEPRFLWYAPSSIELAQTKVHVNDSKKRHLQRQFGHPFLHEPLLTPIVDRVYADLVPLVYNGRVDLSSRSGDARMDATDGGLGYMYAHNGEASSAATLIDSSPPDEHVWAEADNDLRKQAAGGPSSSSRSLAALLSDSLRRATGSDPSQDAEIELTSLPQTPLLHKKHMRGDSIDSVTAYYENSAMQRPRNPLRQDTYDNLYPHETTIPLEHKPDYDRDTSVLYMDEATASHVQDNDPPQATTAQHFPRTTLKESAGDNAASEQRSGKDRAARPPSYATTDGFPDDMDMASYYLYDEPQEPTFVRSDDRVPRTRTASEDTLASNGSPGANTPRAGTSRRLTPMGPRQPLSTSPCIRSSPLASSVALHDASSSDEPDHGPLP